MKVKISVILSEDLLKDIDQLSQHYKNRSEFIETALLKFVASLIRKEENERDMAIINQHASELNEEAEDVLAYQIITRDMDL